MPAENAPDLDTLLKKADARIKHFVAALKAENAGLQRQIAKLEANKVSSENRIKALASELHATRERMIDQDLGPMSELLKKVGR